jgi:hypothetical protein
LRKMNPPRIERIERIGPYPEARRAALLHNGCVAKMNMTVTVFSEGPRLRKMNPPRIERIERIDRDKS